MSYKKGRDEWWNLKFEPNATNQEKKQHEEQINKFKKLDDEKCRELQKQYDNFNWTEYKDPFVAKSKHNAIMKEMMDTIGCYSGHRKKNTNHLQYFNNDIYCEYYLKEITRDLKKKRTRCPNHVNKPLHVIRNTWRN